MSTSCANEIMSYMLASWDSILNLYLPVLILVFPVVAGACLGYIFSRQGLSQHSDKWTQILEEGTHSTSFSLVIQLFKSQQILRDNLRMTPSYLYPMMRHTVTTSQL